MPSELENITTDTLIFKSDKNSGTLIDAHNEFKSKDMILTQQLLDKKKYTDYLGYTANDGNILYQSPFNIVKKYYLFSKKLNRMDWDILKFVGVLYRGDDSDIGIVYKILDNIRDFCRILEKQTSFKFEDYMYMVNLSVKNSSEYRDMGRNFYTPGGKSKKQRKSKSQKNGGKSKKQRTRRRIR